MSADFAPVLRGLMANRGLTSQSVARSCFRADSTIRRLMAGDLAPNAEVLQDIAPALEMTLADLLVIAGLAPEETATVDGRLTAPPSLGRLVAVASRLPREQVQELIEHGKRLEAGATADR